MDFIAFIAASIIAALGVNYLADVLPYTRKFTHPACHACGSNRKVSDYLIGRPCRSCGTSAGLRYLVVYIVAVVLATAIWLNISSDIGRWIAWMIVAFFGLVAVIDLEHRLILHPVSIAGAIIAIPAGFYLHGVIGTLLGGAVGFGFMFLLYYLGGLFGKWMARRRGETIDEVALGFGDVNLAGVCGLLLGWPGVVAGLVFAIVLGGLASLGVIVVQMIGRKYKPFTAIPYAPFLILGTSILLFQAFLRISAGQ